MPRILSESSESEGEEIIMGKKTRDPDSPLAEENGDDEYEDDEDDEGDEVTYVVEKIKGHHIEKGIVLYEIKWQGYEDAENTWEPEENLAGANDILDTYFEEIGGRPSANSKANSAKKRGRKSNISITETQEPFTKKVKTEFQGKKGRPKKEGSNEALVWPEEKRDEWQPPKAMKDAWEDLIVSIETIEQENGIKWVLLCWSEEDEKGKQRKSKAPLQVVYLAAPQAMLRFYESHLVFTAANKTN